MFLTVQAHLSQYLDGILRKRCLIIKPALPFSATLYSALYALNKQQIESAGPRSTVGRAPDSQVRGPGFDTRSGDTLIQEGQLSVTGESMCTKYWLTA